MARTKGASSRRSILLYSVPLIAVALLSAVYYVASLPPTAQQDFTLHITIKVWSIGSNGSLVSQSIIAPAVGVPGGIWKVDTHSTEGLDGRYPVYTEAPPAPSPSYPYPGYSLIHVRSKVDRTYHLGDFFAVWGNFIGPDNTLGYTVPPPSGDARFGPDWYWLMCVGPSTSSLHRGAWGSEPLVSNMFVILLYSDNDPIC